jgi:hypothetical protein
MPASVSVAVHNTVPPTNAAGYTADLQVGSRGSLNVQLMTANAATAIGSDATNGLDVDVTRLPTLVAGTAQIGSAPLGASATVGTGTVNARVKSAVSNNLTSVKASAGKLFGFTLYNSTAAAKFFKIYNKASAPIVASDVPIMTVIVPANGQSNYSNPIGKAFATGIAYAITGAIGDTDATNTAVDDVTGALDYI